MKRPLMISTALLAFALTLCPVWAGGWPFAYKLKPGQTWNVTMAMQNTSTVMGEKDVNRSKHQIRYSVSAGAKKGWVTLTAKFLNNPLEDSGMDMGKMTFTADMHTTGELRNKKVTGSPAPPMGDMEGVPPEMKAMMEQSYKSMGEMWKETVFWFPEFPEGTLDIGDEFEMTQKMSTGGAMGMDAVIKQVFTLEDVSDGLAYFSVHERAFTKTGGLGGKTTTKSAGKGETIFDLKEGMWVELVTRGQSTVNMGSVPGMSGMPGMPSGEQKMQHMTKITVERR
ncbi:MAG: hypothetical protein ABIL58_27805 [Pseudomonadota bacterium]